MPVALKSRRVPEWQALDLGDGQTIEVKIEAPSYEVLVLARAERSTPEAVLRRLDSVVDWRGVVSAPDDEDTAPVNVPFSLDALRDLLREFPMAMNNLLELINPLFMRRAEAEAKNSGTQSLNGTATTLPSTPSTNCGTSVDSAKSSTTE